MNTVWAIAFFLVQCTQVLALQGPDTAYNATRSGIRAVDFTNRSYTIPDRDPDAVPLFGALAQPTGTVVKLTKGTYQVADPVDQDWVRVTLHQVFYGDVTGDNREEALVALRVQTGGTLSWGLLYIYGWHQGKLRLLQAFWTGDRANEGLHKAYADHGRLAVEIFDPKDSQGDCCATRVSKVRLRWNGSKFIEVDRQSSALPATR